MSSEQALKIISEYSRLPTTDEKVEISQKYLNDEIGEFEFFTLANSYLEKVKNQAPND